MIPFRCPHCGFSTKVSPQFAGKTGPCQKCGQPVTIPPLGGVGSPPPPKSGGGNATWVIVAVVLVLVLCILPIGGLFLGVLAFGVAITPAIGQARVAAQNSQSMNNLKQIGLALHNYHDTYGSFPPAYVTDEEGTPLYSWRVLILPFVDQAAMYDSFDREESWDSPQNFAFANTMMPVYVAPNDMGGSAGATSYVMPVGPGMIGEGEKGVKIMDVLDGTSNTILAIDAGYPVGPWAAPIDLDLSNGPPTIGPDGMIRPRDGKILVLFSDGSVQSFDINELPPGQLQSMLTRAGGEVVQR